jgi:hypothetical protein
MIGWIGTVINLTGLYFNARSNKYGWILWMIGSFFSMIHCYINKDWSNFVLFSIYQLGNSYGIYNNFIKKNANIQS